MNLTSYQKLLHDPYTVAPQSNVKVEGNTVHIFASSSDTVSAPPHGAIGPPTIAPISYRLFGYGGISFQGVYRVDWQWDADMWFWD
jgi:hypothetical protein